MKIKTKCPISDHEFENRCEREKCLYHGPGAPRSCIRLFVSASEVQMDIEQAAKFKGIPVEKANIELARARVRSAQLLTLRQFVRWIDDNLQPTAPAVVPSVWPFNIPELGIKDYNVRHVTSRKAWEQFARGKTLPVDHQEALANEED